MTAPSGGDTQILARMLAEARALARTSDPLLKGQYEHLAGRIDALLATAPGESVASGGDRLNGRVALVTGAASGLGRAIAARFASEGARVMIADIDERRGMEAASALGDSGAFVRCDHTKPAETAAAVQAALSRFGALDILHNNAGGPFAGVFDQADEATITRVLDVNLAGALHMTRAALIALRESGKRNPAGAVVLFTSSLQGLKAKPNFSLYTIAKHAIVGAVRSLALELAPQNIRVNALCPTVTETPMLPSFFPRLASEPDEARKILRATVPLGRMPEPIDTANAALFLASDEARMLTGVALPVDGGQMAS